MKIAARVVPSIALARVAFPTVRLVACPDSQYQRSTAFLSPLIQMLIRSVSIANDQRNKLFN